MALADSLRAGFSRSDAPAGDRFDLAGALGGLGDEMDAVRPPAVELDRAAIDGLAAQAGSGDISSVAAAAQGVAAQANASAGALPDPSRLLAPILGPIQAIERLSSEQPGRFLDTLIADVDRARDGRLGLASLGAPLETLRGHAGGSIPATILDVLRRLLPQIGIDRGIAAAAGHAVAAADLVAGLGGLMAVHGAAEDVREAGARVAAQLRADEIDLLTRAVQASAASTAIDDALAAVTDPDDDLQVERAAAPIFELCDAVRALGDALRRGLAFGEATLIYADPARSVEQIQVATGALSAFSADRIRAAATQVQEQAQRLLPLDGPPASFDDVWDHARALIAPITAAVNAFDSGIVTRPVAGAIGQVTAIAREIQRVLGEVTAAIRAAFEAVRQLVLAIDLRRIVSEIRRFLAPVVEVIGRLEQMVGAVIATVERGVEAAMRALEALETNLERIAGTIKGAFDTVGRAIQDLGLDRMVDQLRAGIQQVVDALHRVQLQPYFDTATDVMNTTVDVVSIIPLELLPADTKRDLDAKIQPIQRIDFDRDVRVVLVNQRDEIFAQLDTEVLGEVQAAYEQVIAFLDEINPRPPLEDLEERYFDPLVERIRAIDPDEVLAPVTDAIDRVRETIAGFDLRERVLGPIEEVFDRILEGFDRLDPTPLLQPIEERVDTARADLIRFTRLDTWADRVAELHASIQRMLDRLDLAVIAERLDAAYGSLVSTVEDPRDDTSVLGGLIALLAEGTGVPVRATSFGATSRWVRGDDGAAEARAMLVAGREPLEATLTKVRAVDVAAVSSAASSKLSAVRSALAAHPERSALRSAIEPLLARSSPTELLAPMAAHRERFQERLDRAVSAVRGLEGSGLSAVTDASGRLRDGLRPLAPVRDRALGLLRQAGIDATGLSGREILGAVLTALRPSRVLSPFVPLVTALKTKAEEILVHGLIDPAKQGITELRALLDAIDITFVREGLNSVHAEIRAQIVAVRPTEILRDVLAAVDSLQERLVSWDPLASIREAIDRLKGMITTVVDELRPTVLLEEVLNAYDQILAAASGLDVRKLLDPVLAELRSISDQLDHGLQGAGGTFTRLQGTLARLGGGGSATVTASVG